jgi:ABC-type metal ion transport system substrate-binding protein
VNLIAVRAVDKDQACVKDLIDAYRTAEVKASIDAKFNQTALAGW